MPIAVPISEMLCNDASESALELTDFWSTTGTTQIINNDLIFTPSQQGYHRVFYTVKSCDLKMDNAYFEVFVGPCLNCAKETPCENLICTYDFEEFEDDYVSPVFTLGGVYWVFNYSNNFSNDKQNSTDICTDINGNKYLSFFYERYSTSLPIKDYREGIAIKLKEPIKKGCTLKIEFDASVFAHETELVIMGSKFPPCKATDALIEVGCTQTNCNSNNSYEPFCLTNQPFLISKIGSNINGSCPADLSEYESYVFTYNNSLSLDREINYIIFYLESSENSSAIYIDNLRIIKDCACNEVDVIPILCNKFEFSAFDCDPGNTYFWNFGDLNSPQPSSTDNPANHTFTSNGTYTVTLTVTDECEHVNTSTHLINVNCDPIPQCNCPTGYTIGVDQYSETNISATSLPFLTFGQMTPICINGKLIVNRPFQYFLDKTIYMGPGASIEISSGYSFYTQNSNYLPCNGMMYKGIFVNGGNLTAFNNHIYDAHVGIDFQNGSISGGLQENTFDRNYIGININGQLTGDTRIIGNHFISNGSYLTAYPDEPTKLGTMNKTWAGVNLTFNSLVSVNDGNEFFGIGAGVRANKSILIMNNNHAKDLLFTAAFESGAAIIASNCPSLAVNNNLIENCVMGIAIKNSNLSADSNSIDNCDWGFYLEKMDYRNLQISNSQKIYFNDYGISLKESSNLASLNIFSNKLKGLSLDAIAAIFISGNGGSNQGNANIFDHYTEFSIPSGCRGIEINNYQRLNIYNNNISYQSGGRQGIFLNNSQRSFLGKNTISGFKENSPNSVGIGIFKSPYNTYCCNLVPGNATGMYFSGDCDQSHLKHNVMSNNDYGLQCGLESWIGFQKLGNSNLWPGSAFNFEALHNGSDDNMRRSRFDVTEGPSDYFPVPTPPSNWFAPRVGNNKSCTIDISCAIPVRPDTLADEDDRYYRFYNDEEVIISPTDEFTTDPVSDWGNYAAGQSWNSKIQLLEKLELFPELLGQSELIDSFYTVHQTGLSRDYFTTRMAIKKAANLSSTNYSEIKYFQNGMISSIAIIDSIDQLLALPDADTATLMSQRTLELLALDTLRLHYVALTDSIELNRISTFINLYNQTLLLPTTNDIQAEEKVISLHLTQFMIQGKDYLTSSLLTEIFEIANQCIFLNSYSIGLARMLYTEVVDFEFNDDILCIPPQPVITDSKNHTVDSSIRIYPNPSKEWVVVENLNKNLKINNIKIFDLHGRLILNQTNSKNLHKIQLDANLINTGVYLIKIEFSTGEWILKKLLIE